MEGVNAVANPGGRPKVRDLRVQVGLTRAQHGELQAAASASGHTLSDEIRVRLFGARHPVDQPDPVRVLLEAFAGEGLARGVARRRVMAELGVSESTVRRRDHGIDWPGA